MFHVGSLVSCASLLHIDVYIYIYSIFIVFLTNNPGEIKQLLSLCLWSARGLAVGVFLSTFYPQICSFPSNFAHRPTKITTGTKKEVWLKKLPRSNVDVVINVLASPKTAEMLPITGMKSATQNKGITCKEEVPYISGYMKRFCCPVVTLPETNNESASENRPNPRNSSEPTMEPTI